MPEVSTGEAPATAATPGQADQIAMPAGSAMHTVAAGENLSLIATRNNMSLTKLLELNPEYKSNPNAVQVGAVIKLNPPVTPVAVTPVASPVSATPPTPIAPVKPATPTSAPATQTPSQKLKQFSIDNSPKPAAPVTPPTPQQIADIQKKGADLKVQADKVIAEEQAKNKKK